MGSLALDILKNWLIEWDTMKSIAKIVESSEKEFLMISYMYQY